MSEKLVAEMIGRRSMPSWVQTAAPVPQITSYSHKHGLHRGCAAKLEAVEHLGIEAFTKQQIEGLVGKTVLTTRADWQSLGHSESYQPQLRPASLLLRIGHETFVNHVNQPWSFDHRSDQAEVIETLDANLFHVTPLPEAP